MNALAAWTGRRPTPASVDVESMAEGRELIGQELVPVTAPVPVIPLTPSATSGLGGELEAGRAGDHQFAGGQGGDQQLALLPHGDVPRGGESEGLLPEEVQGNGSGGRPGEVEPTMNVGISTGIPNGGGMSSTATPENAVEKRMDGIWPGGPMTARPRSFGPAMMPSPGGPLFDYEQLRRFQELYESAPGIYGQTQPREVGRPEVLQEEEELQRRLAELQDQKRREQEEWEQRQLRAQQERLEKEFRQHQRGIENREQEMLRKVMMENLRLKEELQGFRKDNEDKEKSSPVVEEFKTPEEKGEAQWMAGVARQLQMEEDGRRRAALPEDASQHQSKAEPRGTVPGGEPSSGDTMKFMMMMLESMQQLIKDREGGRGGGDAEVVKTVVELPKLPEWSHETGPIDLGDWIATIDPFMEDLSDTAEIWWKLLRKEAMAWYEEHMAMSPLQRLTHEVVPSEEISKSKWSRLERRAAGLLMAAIPSNIREEIVSTRSVNAMGILTRPFTVYQPGGLAEKALILTSLENPKEESSVSGAVQALRRWIRWRRRAADVGVSVPDPTVLMKGLTRLTKRVMSANPELAFRVSLARNTLLVDSIPNHKTVSQLADHILAEFEQLQHQDRKQRDAAGGDPAKAKEIKTGEQGGGKAKGKGKEKGGKGSGGEVKCRFYLTDSGCRKGRECNFSHDQTDNKKRCYACGSVDHYAPDCPRKASSVAGATSGGSSNGSPGKPRAAKAAEDIQKEDTSKPPSEAGGGSSTDGETVQQLLVEANKMLKSLSTKERPTTVTHDERMRALQEQLDELKGKALKTLRLTRITKGGVAGLLDSGATHPMRAARKDESVHNYKRVEVTLASGKVEEMKISPKGVMVLEGKDAQNVEPIVPMGMLVSRLRCQLHWNEEGLHAWHPKRGYLDISVQNGCPQISRSLALKLIQELERVMTFFSTTARACVGRLECRSEPG